MSLFAKQRIALYLWLARHLDTMLEFIEHFTIVAGNPLQKQKGEKFNSPLEAHAIARLA